MSRFAIILTTLAMATVACSGNGPTTSSPDMATVGPLFAAGGNGVVHHVSAGGHDLDLAGNTDANFSLVAIEHGDGRVTGQYTDQFGQQDGGFHAEINCLSVLGNTAWVSGTITSGNSGGIDLTGLPVITRVRDVGTSANDPPDLISFSFIGVGISCQARPNLPLLPMTDGQVTVD